MNIKSSRCEFVTEMSATDAVHGARALAEEHIERHISIYATFLDLGKSFNKITYGVIWWAFRKHSGRTGQDGLPKWKGPCAVQRRCNKRVSNQGRCALRLSSFPAAFNHSDGCCNL